MNVLSVISNWFVSNKFNLLFSLVNLVGYVLLGMASFKFQQFLVGLEVDSTLSIFISIFTVGSVFLYGLFKLTTKNYKHLLKPQKKDFIDKVYRGIIFTFFAGTFGLSLFASGKIAIQDFTFLMFIMPPVIPSLLYTQFSFRYKKDKDEFMTEILSILNNMQMINLKKNETTNVVSQ